MPPFLARNTHCMQSTLCATCNLRGFSGCELRDLAVLLFALCTLHFAVRKLRLTRFHFYLPESLHFAVCSSQFANCGSEVTRCSVHTPDPGPQLASCELQAASCNFALCSSQLAARKFQPELRAATLQLAARSSQLAGSDTELKSSRLHVALRTSHVAVLAQGVRSRQIAERTSHLAPRSMLHERASEGSQCAPRTSHVTRPTSESCIVLLAARSLPLAHRRK